MGSGHAAVLVEGPSDRQAVLAFARRLGRDLAGEGVEVIDLGGVTNFGRVIEDLGPRGDDRPLAGLYDAGEEFVVARALRRAGVVEALPDRAAIAAAGFFVCERDLEDELIRALGAAAVERIIVAAGEQRAWQTFQQQPAQADRSVVDRLRRFCGTRSGRKIRYARLFVEALDPQRPPPPLRRLLDHV